jgi:hypothetical protein
MEMVGKAAGDRESYYTSSMAVRYSRKCGESKELGGL